MEIFVSPSISLDAIFGKRIDEGIEARENYNILGGIFELNLDDHDLKMYAFVIRNWSRNDNLNFVL